MSTTTATTNVTLASDGDYRLNDDEFDKLFESAQKREREGKGAREYREAVKEIDNRFAPNEAEDTTQTADTGSTDDTAQETSVEAGTAVEGEQHQQDTSTTGATTTEGTGAKDEANAWLDSLDPSIRQHVDRLLEEKAKAENEKQQYIRSNEGRLAAEQRKARDYQRQLEQIRQQPQTAATRKEEQQVTKAENERLKALKEADPFLGEYLEQIENEKQALADKIKGLETTFETTKKDQEERFVMSQVDIVRSQVQNVEEIWESDYFRQFIEDYAPAWVLRENNNPTAESALKVLRAYGDWANHVNSQLEQQGNGGTTSATTQTAAVPAANNAQAQKIQQERERKASAAPVQKSSVTRPSPNTPSDSLDGVSVNDPEQFDKWVRAQTEAARKRLRGETT